MKKLLTLLAIIVSLTIFAQAPQGFNYQATARNSSGVLITNQSVLFKFSILQNSVSGTSVYSENQTATTDDLGHVNLVVGQGTPTKGTFSTINWANGTYYLGIELNTGSGYVAMGTTQLLSVPFALYANTSGIAQNSKRTSIYLTGDITNAQAATKIATELGPQTENIYIRNTTQLTTVDLSAMVNAVQIDIRSNAVLTNINLNGLTTVYNQLYIFENPQLNTVLVQSLTDSFEFEVFNAITLNISSLVKCNTFSVANITNFTPPINLLKCNYITISNMPNMTTLSLPIVESDYLSINYNPLLTSVSFPALTSCKFFSFNSNALPSPKINSLLRQLLTISPSFPKSIDLSNQNPLAPPTGQGIIDKETLINAGNIVTTD